MSRRDRRRPHPEFTMSCTTRTSPAAGSTASNDPRSFARSLGINLRHLAEYANVAPETPTLQPLDARLQRYMRDARTVLDRATRLGGGRAAARDWFRHMPLATFAYRTAEEMVSEGRVGELLHYLDGVERWDTRAALPTRDAGAAFALSTPARGDDDSPMA
ncbi:hypothetical protein B1806_06650 [Metallibacterium scheffleri]|uniref:Antitoxin Xre/MbcA/ParS-like toxin-binding domain-containing protein n=2 Tax=Metallibacterium scheffleri TaxID=993689 RepID=A0A4S3KP77_9GAMM|nr:hypothetical protein B1806_06650 [Metallibacterium scheffleri]